jgi:hypothetical protein
MPNFFLLWLPSRIVEKKIDLCENYAEIRAFDGNCFGRNIDVVGGVIEKLRNKHMLRGNSAKYWFAMFCLPKFFLHKNL